MLRGRTGHQVAAPGRLPCRAALPLHGLFGGGAAARDNADDLPVVVDIDGGAVHATGHGQQPVIPPLPQEGAPVAVVVVRGPDDLAISTLLSDGPIRRRAGDPRFSRWPVRDPDCNNDGVSSTVQRYVLIGRRRRREMVLDLARAAVTEAAPEELPLFDRTAGALLRRRGRPAFRHRDVLSSGLELTLHTVTEVALAAASAGAGVFLATGVEQLSAGFWGRLAGRLRRRGRRRAAGDAAAATTVAALSVADLERVRAAASHAARSAGVAEHTATVIAEAIVGRLVLGRGAGAITGPMVPPAGEASAPDGVAGLETPGIGPSPKTDG
ncbi:hypothetical protein [Actinoplanes sp. NPDC049316]|uniref:hypothetical protein n=1 Tax=Actinoplanes sp. NPDC049316 TaxID=3154727 RepID=UPI003417A0A5